MGTHKIYSGIQGIRDNISGSLYGDCHELLARDCGRFTHHVSNAKRNTGAQAIPQNRILTLKGTPLGFFLGLFLTLKHSFSQLGTLFKLITAPEIS